MTNPTASDSFHVIVGAGPTGCATARLLASTGNAVKVVSRSGSGPTEPGIELVTADASNPAALTRIARGATAIYNCANPQYHTWTTDWPPLAASILAAAAETDAVLVTLSNLYAYAPPTGVMRATDPLNATSVKGRVRAQMWHDALAAHNAGRVRATEARASDFIGPGLGSNSHMGDRVMHKIIKGKPALVLGTADAKHSWTAIDDVARTLVTLANDSRAWGRAWHVPSAAPLTQRELIRHTCELAGVTPIKVKTIPRVAVRGFGVFVPALREMVEILYQFEAPFVFDSQETTDTFALEATPLDQTLRAALASYGHASERQPTQAA